MLVGLLSAQALRPKCTTDDLSITLPLLLPKILLIMLRRCFNSAHVVDGSVWISHRNFLRDF